VNLNFLEPFGPLQACNGTALPLRLLQAPHRFKTYGGAKIYLLALLASNLHGGEYSILRPRHLTSEEETPIPCVGDWVGSTACGSVFRKYQNFEIWVSIDSDYEKYVFLWYDSM